MRLAPIVASLALPGIPQDVPLQVSARDNRSLEERVNAAVYDREGGVFLPAEGDVMTAIEVPSGRPLGSFQAPVPSTSKSSGYGGAGLLTHHTGALFGGPGAQQLTRVLLEPGPSAPCHAHPDTHQWSEWTAKP